MTLPRSLPQREVTDAWWRRYVETRDADVRARLIEQYLGLVHHAAREIAQQVSGPLELDDLVSAGTVGLIQALEGFDPSRGFAFTSYAVPRIRGAIVDEIRSLDFVPRSVRERNRRLRETAESLRRRLDRDPNDEEMARALGLDVETYWRHAADLRGPVLVPLDAAPAEEGDAAFTLGELLADTAGPDQARALEDREMWHELARVFTSLSARDRLVLTLSYYEGLTLKEIGDLLHITESRVSRLRTRALRRVQERMEREGAGTGRKAA